MENNLNMSPRKVGILLGIGIFLIPIIFAWFTLRRGHSTLSRVASLAWLLTSFALSFVLTAYENSQKGGYYDRFADKVTMDVRYKGEGCKEPSPILITITNSSDEKIDRYGWKVSVKAKGRSTELNANPYVTSSDLIVDPGHQVGFCTEIPVLSDYRYPVDELEFKPTYVNVYEPR